MKAKVYITPKKSVLDPQGKTVQHAIASSGMFDLKEARVGKYIELDLGNVNESIANQKVKEMCEKLLANTVIEDYRFEISAN